MITKNFYAAIASQVTAQEINNVLRLHNGTAVRLSASTSFAPFDNWTLRLNVTQSGFVVGTGTTPATVNDYKLESQITSGLSSSGSTAFYRFDDAGFERVMSCVITNTSSEAITISEVGKVASINYFKTETATTTTSGATLIERNVLDTPVTIPAGEHKTITYTIRMNYPG